MFVIVRSKKRVKPVKRIIIKVKKRKKKSKSTNTEGPTGVPCSVSTDFEEVESDLGTSGSGSFYYEIPHESPTVPKKPTRMKTKSREEAISEFYDMPAGPSSFTDPDLLTKSVEIYKDDKMAMVSSKPIEASSPVLAKQATHIDVKEEQKPQMSKTEPSELPIMAGQAGPPRRAMSIAGETEMGPETSMPLSYMIPNGAKEILKIKIKKEKDKGITEAEAFEIPEDTQLPLDGTHIKVKQEKEQGAAPAVHGEMPTDQYRQFLVKVEKDVEKLVPLPTEIPSKDPTMRAQYVKVKSEKESEILPSDLDLTATFDTKDPAKRAQLVKFKSEDEKFFRIPHTSSPGTPLQRAHSVVLRSEEAKESILHYSKPPDGTPATGLMKEPPHLTIKSEPETEVAAFPPPQSVVLKSDEEAEKQDELPSAGPLEWVQHQPSSLKKKIGPDHYGMLSEAPSEQITIKFEKPMERSASIGLVKSAQHMILTSVEQAETVRSDQYLMSPKGPGKTDQHARTPKEVSKSKMSEMDVRPPTKDPTELAQHVIIKSEENMEILKMPVEVPSTDLAKPGQPIVMESDEESKPEISTGVFSKGFTMLAQRLFRSESEKDTSEIPAAVLTKVLLKQAKGVRTESKEFQDDSTYDIHLGFPSDGPAKRAQHVHSKIKDEKDTTETAEGVPYNRSAKLAQNEVAKLEEDSKFETRISVLPKGIAKWAQRFFGSEAESEESTSDVSEGIPTQGSAKQAEYVITETKDEQNDDTSEMFTGVPNRGPEKWVQHVAMESKEELLKNINEMPVGVHSKGYRKQGNHVVVESGDEQEDFEMVVGVPSKGPAKRAKSVVIESEEEQKQKRSEMPVGFPSKGLAKRSKSVVIKSEKEQEDERFEMPVGFPSNGLAKRAKSVVIEPEEELLRNTTRVPVEVHSKGPRKQGKYVIVESGDEQEDFEMVVGVPSKGPAKQAKRIVVESEEKKEYNTSEWPVGVPSKGPAKRAKSVVIESEEEQKQKRSEMLVVFPSKGPAKRSKSVVIKSEKEQEDERFELPVGFPSKGPAKRSKSVRIEPEEELLKNTTRVPVEVHSKGPRKQGKYVIVESGDEQEDFEMVVGVPSKGPAKQAKCIVVESEEKKEYNTSEWPVGFPSKDPAKRAKSVVIESEEDRENNRYEMSIGFPSKGPAKRAKHIVIESEEGQEYNTSEWPVGVPSKGPAKRAKSIVIESEEDHENNRYEMPIGVPSKGPAKRAKRILTESEEDLEDDKEWPVGFSSKGPAKRPKPVVTESKEEITSEISTDAFPKNVAKWAQRMLFGSEAEVQQNESKV
ncbi:uncharacterized protein LOC114654990 isoform X5 [Erpetoichthys calabaricus]|uniref:uncharacterized protein LOC114654990 isoform X5 n=1 Tax=Erpetoichthys calabaricus TaxID=27687 RepID=UPI00223445F0|nr:uncharacterized protein LOC114654990 isoform X5 [Erpetoichthys calabaricus]